MQSSAIIPRSHETLVQWQSTTRGENACHPQIHSSELPDELFRVACLQEAAACLIPALREHDCRRAPKSNWTANSQKTLSSSVSLVSPCCGSKAFTTERPWLS